MKDIILCIDDEPDRYHSLSDSFKDGIVLVTDCPATFEFYLGHYRSRILGICLDHDMRFKPGTWFANRLINESFPVAITSVNTPFAAIMAEKLYYAGIDRVLLPFGSSDDWAYLILDFFKNEKRN